jgi:hypothetical protein
MRSRTRYDTTGPYEYPNARNWDNAGEPRVIVYRGTSTLYRPVGRG